MRAAARGCSGLSRASRRPAADRDTGTAPAPPVRAADLRWRSGSRALRRAVRHAPAQPSRTADPFAATAPPTAPAPATTAPKPARAVLNAAAEAGAAVAAPPANP